MEPRGAHPPHVSFDVVRLSLKLIEVLIFDRFGYNFHVDLEVEQLYQGAVEFRIFDVLLIHVVHVDGFCGVKFLEFAD